MRAIEVRNPGPGYTLAIAEVATPQPGPGEVLIKIAAAGLNHADQAQAMGTYSPPGAPATLGAECSGEIVELGAGVTDFAIGDTVCALLSGGGYAEYTAVSEKLVLPVPRGVDVVDAAALPEAHFTAWTNLMDAARLQPGESVLVHGGSSGIGSGAIQMLHARGHVVFATAGSAEKCAAIAALGCTAINYREQDFVEVVTGATGGRGVDVILDIVGGEYIQRNISAAAVWGRIVNIAYQSGMEATVNFAPVLVKRLTLLATTLRSRSNEEKGVIRDALLREVWPLIEAGKIKPVVDSVYPLAEAQAAHARLATSDHIGKILLAP
jgi:putative PIG3 family NAD(P)H quinone oxidoreductase